MSEIVSDPLAMEIAIAVGSAHRIILNELENAGALDHEKVLAAFDEKIEDLIVNREKIDAANLLRMIRGEIGRPGRA